MGEIEFSIFFKVTKVDKVQGTPVSMATYLLVDAAAQQPEDSQKSQWVRDLTARYGTDVSKWGLKLLANCVPKCL